ncbi:MAG: TfoX/Sxy family protein [Chitinophagaceae bacterium]|nr:TfoX/Sxy family protein [Rubrivivax sp.]
MPVSAHDQSFVAHCLELLAPLGAVRARRMFGGHGLYVDDLFVAVIAFDRLYLKAQDSSRQAFVDAGSQPFVFAAKGKEVTMGYWSAPEVAMDSPAAMLAWGRLAMAAALAARAAKAATAPKPASKPRARVPKR